MMYRLLFITKDRPTAIPPDIKAHITYIKPLSWNVRRHMNIEVSTKFIIISLKLNNDPVSPPKILLPIHTECETILRTNALFADQLLSLNCIKLIAKVSSVIPWAKSIKNFLLQLLKKGDSVELINRCLKFTIKVVKIIEIIDA